MNKKKSIKNKNEFLNYMLDLLEPMGEISYKPLFGGYAICKHDAAFALVFDGAVYFKTDTTNRKDYESYNSNPLTYRKQGKTILRRKQQKKLSQTHKIKLNKSQSLKQNPSLRKNLRLKMQHNDGSLWCFW